MYSRDLTSFTLNAFSKRLRDRGFVLALWRQTRGKSPLKPVYTGSTRSFRHLAGMSVRAHLLPEVRRLPSVYRFIIGPPSWNPRGPRRGPLWHVINCVFFVDIFFSFFFFFTRRPQPVNLYDWSRVVSSRNLRKTRLIKFLGEKSTFFFFHWESRLFPFRRCFMSLFFYRLENSNISPSLPPSLKITPPRQSSLLLTWCINSRTARL